MSRSFAKLGAMMAGGLMLAGCTQTLVVAPHAVRCDVGAELSAYKCPSPKQIQEDSTFQMIVDAAKDDRQALAECGRNMEALQNSLAKCNQAVDEFNKKIDEVNAKNQGGKN